MPAGSTTFDFQASWDVEEDYDFVIVEVHTVGQDNWTTLPEVGGHAMQTLGSCEIAWNSVHPFVDHYQTFDPATATCVPSNATTRRRLVGPDRRLGRLGPAPLRPVGLRGPAGRGVDLLRHRLRRERDHRRPGRRRGPTNDSVSTPLTGFEAGDLDGFTTPPAPEGSPTLRRTWVATGTIDLPGEESAGVVTTDTVILPFGLEQITDTAIRDDIVGDAMRWLLRDDENPPPPSGS